MSAPKALRKIQMGKESAAGTAVAATALFRGMGTIEDQREVEFVEEDVGYISGTDRTMTPKLLAGIEFEETPATFEQLPYILNAGVEGVAGVKDGSGTGYIYTYTFPTTALKTPYTYTIEGGDGYAVEEMEYSLVEEFQIAGEAGGPVNMSAKWFGRQVSSSSFTGAIAVPSVDEMLFGNSKLYIDAIGGTIGTTQKTGTLLAWTYKVVTGWQPRFTGDGNLYFTGHAFDPSKLEITCEITFEHDAAAAAAKTAFRAETPILLQIAVTGPACATGGTAYQNKTLKLNMCGKWESVEKLDEIDGNDVVKAVLRARYNSTAAQFASIICVNELVTLP
jgi:hypothetical protein